MSITITSIALSGLAKLLHAMLYYFTYSILNWGRAANSTIQPLIKLKSKVVKLVKPSNHTSLEKNLQH